MFIKYKILAVVIILALVAGCSSGPSREEITLNEDINAVTSVHKFLLQLDREHQQKREEFKNLTVEAVLNPRKMNKQDKERINKTMGNYPETLDSYVARAESIKVPSVHNVAAKTELQSSINSATQMFRMYRKHFDAFTSLNLDGAAAINDQCNQLGIEVAMHLANAYKALGISIDRIDETNGGLKQ